MPLDTDQMAAELDAMIADLPATLRFEGKDILCAANDLGTLVTFEPAVQAKQRNILVTANLGNFPKEPKAEMKCSLTLFGQKTAGRFIIDSVAFHPDNNGVALTLRNDSDRPGS